jgi:hypothetical protein
MLDYSIVILVENLNIEYHRKFRDHSLIKALLMNLSGNNRKQARNNTAVYQNERNGPGGG